MTSSAVPPPLPLALCRFAVVDVEATGSAPPAGRLLEVAVAMLEGGTVHLAYDALLDPGMPVPAAVARLTGITDQMVAGCPRFADRSEEHTSELQSQSNLVCRLLLEKKNSAILQYSSTVAR